MSRGKNAKDVDWSEVAATFDDIEPVIFVIVDIDNVFNQINFTGCRKTRTD